MPVYRANRSDGGLIIPALDREIVGVFPRVDPSEERSSYAYIGIEHALSVEEWESVQEADVLGSYRHSYHIDRRLPDPIGFSALAVNIEAMPDPKEEVAAIAMAIAEIMRSHIPSGEQVDVHFDPKLDIYETHSFRFSGLFRETMGYRRHRMHNSGGDFGIYYEVSDRYRATSGTVAK